MGSTAFRGGAVRKKAGAAEAAPAGLSKADAYGVAFVRKDVVPSLVLVAASQVFASHAATL